MFIVPDLPPPPAIHRFVKSYEPPPPEGESPRRGQSRREFKHTKREDSMFNIYYIYGDPGEVEEYRQEDEDLYAGHITFEETCEMKDQDTGFDEF